MLLYYITDRAQFPGDETARRRLLLEKIAEAAHRGVDFIQLREKDLPARDLETLARQAIQTIREIQLRTENREPRTVLLPNSRLDIAIACHAEGVHLRSDDVPPSTVRALWKKCGAGAPARETHPPEPVISISCHSSAEVARAAAEGADLAIFAPVFEKLGRPQAHAGLDGLSQACANKIPVLALGGVTLENAAACLQAGAAGVAGIRLFQENNLEKTVQKLRALPGTVSVRK